MFKNILILYISLNKTYVTIVYNIKLGKYLGFINSGDKDIS